ncbi:MAG: phytanoyl-CoA dioxygenase family protein [Candidatus Nanopelagicales bacterium]|nr:phytanoyl-CoA dioxygenase family protein [Candidatus Nanopelagicales bacterium]
MSEAVESVLRFPRLARTVAAARSFNAASSPPASTAGQAQFNMRSAMDLDPRLGKWVSRQVIRHREPAAWQVADLKASRIVDVNEVEKAVATIRRDGFYVFDQVVDRSITDAIRSFAEQAPSTARGAGTPPAVYPRSAPAVGRYDIDEPVGLQCPEIQEFVTDPVMALIAQRYLGQPVLMDEVAFWWTTTQRAEDADTNAQLFHQDRDRLSFLKFFIYLTDVEPDTGPHVYIKGSHRRLPWSLRGDGRKSDEAVRAAGLWGEVTEICGPAGSVMAVDTIGLHKGKTPTRGDRLALENEFSTSLFGQDYERPVFEPTELVRERFAQMPWVLQRYANAVQGQQH